MNKQPSKRTIFQSKIILPVLSVLATSLLKLRKWKVMGNLPPHDKYVIIVAPHTSNWDFFWGMCAVLSKKWEVNWVGKASLFSGVKGIFMRWLGGIAVDRKHAESAVDSYISLIEKTNQINIVLTPEGTRSYVDKWKTGFYRIANGADIPISMAFIDFEKKEMGFGPMLVPSGNYEQDKIKIKHFYKNVTGKHPTKFCNDFK